MKPRLLFVINSLEGGGAERVISNLANFFAKKNYSVSIVCLNKAEASYAVVEEVKVIHLVERKGSNVAFRIWYAVLTFFKLISVINKESPKCVVSFMTSVNLWTGITCLLLRIPYVVSERTTPDHTINKLKHFMKWLSYIVYSRSKAIVVPSKGMIDCFKKNNSFKHVNNFKIISNPVNSFKRTSGIKVHPRRFILSVGRLEPPKGFDQLIDAYSKLPATDIDLLISGEGKDREKMTMQIQQLGLNDRVKLVGFKNNLQDYYQQAELFVLSSRREGYPNALVEAMSYGCASVATNCEFGPAEIIKHGTNGLLVDVNNVDELAHSIHTVLENPSLKQILSRNAKVINQTNSIETISQQWEKLILS